MLRKRPFNLPRQQGMGDRALRRQQRLTASALGWMTFGQAARDEGHFHGHHTGCRFEHGAMCQQKEWRFMIRNAGISQARPSSFPRRTACSMRSAVLVRAEGLIHSRFDQGRSSAWGDTFVADLRIGRLTGSLRNPALRCDLPRA